MWFEALAGLRDESLEQVRKNISVAGNILKSCIYGKEYVSGRFETPIPV